MGCKALYLLILVSAVVYVQAALQENKESRSALVEKQLSRGVRNVLGFPNGWVKSPHNSEEISKILENIKALVERIEVLVEGLVTTLSTIVNDITVIIKGFIDDLLVKITALIQSLATCLSHNKCKV